MGEAKRRGTLEQRVAEGEAKRVARLVELRRLRLEKWNSLTPEQKQKVTAMLAARGTLVIDESTPFKAPGAL